MSDLLSALQASLVTLAMQRVELAARKANLDAKMTAFADTMRDERSILAHSASVCANTENDTRALAVLVREHTGEKKPTLGVEIKDAPTYSITDHAAALAWAKASLIGYVPESIDVSAITGTVAKLGVTLAFVQKHDGYKAYIASDLLAVITLPTTEAA